MFCTQHPDDPTLWCMDQFLQLFLSGHLPRCQPQYRRLGLQWQGQFSEAAKEGVFLRRFLEELGLGSTSPTALTPPTSLSTHNKAARDLAYNPEHHEKTKHIERRHFYVRELVENEELIVPFVSTTTNVADFFTKPLAGEQFYRLRKAMPS